MLSADIIIVNSIGLHNEAYVMKKMRKNMYIGIDLGTSEVKIVLMNESGVILAKEGVSLSISRPQPRWSEQDPELYWMATDTAMLRLKAAYPDWMQQVKSIGLSGQMHGAILLDDQDKVLRPCILWNDTRSDIECSEMMANISDLTKIAGNLAMPGFTAPKVLWVQKNEPEIFAKTTTILLPKDFLRLYLTGKKISDMSDAAGTLWLDVAKRDWSDYLLSATGLDRSYMPDLVEGSESSGYLKPELAFQWGLPDSVVVAGGGGDNAASAIGIGAIHAGDGFISLGTSGVLFVVNDQYRPNPESAVHAFCHAIPDKWHQMGVMLTAASALSWLAKLLGSNEIDLLAELSKKMFDECLTAPLFLPYLSGERTPHNDPFAVGVFHGLNHETDRSLLTYSVLEGVTFGLADCLAALQNAGTEVNELSLVGGGAKSAFWAQLIADALNVRIITRVGGEAGGALGAARLGQLAMGGSLESVCSKPEIDHIFIPDLNKHTALQLRLNNFRALYQRL